MSTYTKHDFSDGNILFAESLNQMDSQIAENSRKSETYSVLIDSLKDSVKLEQYEIDLTETVSGKTVVGRYGSINNTTGGSHLNSNKSYLRSNFTYVKAGTIIEFKGYSYKVHLYSSNKTSSQIEYFDLTQNPITTIPYGCYIRIVVFNENGIFTDTDINKYIGIYTIKETTKENEEFSSLANILEVAETYLDATYNKENLVYESHSKGAYDEISLDAAGEVASKSWVNSAGKNTIVCNVLVNLLLKGTTYEMSRYNIDPRNVNLEANWAWHSDSNIENKEDLEIVRVYNNQESKIVQEDDKVYIYFSWSKSAVQQYSNGEACAEKTLIKELENQASVLSKVSYFSYKKDQIDNSMPWAYDYMGSFRLARYMNDRGLLKKIDSSVVSEKNNLKPGDIIFGGTDSAKGNYLEIGHSAIVLNVTRFFLESSKQWRTHFTCIEAWPDTDSDGKEIGVRIKKYENFSGDQGTSFKWKYYGSLPLISAPVKIKTVLEDNDGIQCSPEQSTVQLKSYNNNGELFDAGVYTIYLNHSDAYKSKDTYGIKVADKNNKELLKTALCKGQNVSELTFYAQRPFNFVIYNNKKDSFISSVQLVKGIKAYNTTQEINVNQRDLYEKIQTLSDEIKAIDSSSSSIDESRLQELKDSIENTIMTEVDGKISDCQSDINNHSNRITQNENRINSLSVNVEETITKVISDTYPTKEEVQKMLIDGDLTDVDIATKTDLDAYAKKVDLNTYAEKADLDSYVEKTDLDSYAEKTDLNIYQNISKKSNNILAYDYKGEYFLDSDTCFFGNGALKISIEKEKDSFDNYGFNIVENGANIPSINYKVALYEKVPVESNQTYLFYVDTKDVETKSPRNINNYYYIQDSESNKKLGNIMYYNSDNYLYFKTSATTNYVDIMVCFKALGEQTAGGAKAYNEDIDTDGVIYFYLQKDVSDITNKKLQKQEEELQKRIEDSIDVDFNINVDKNSGDCSWILLKMKRDDIELDISPNTESEDDLWRNYPYRTNSNVYKWLKNHPEKLIATNSNFSGGFTSSEIDKKHYHMRYRKNISPTNTNTTGNYINSGAYVSELGITESGQYTTRSIFAVDTENQDFKYYHMDRKKADAPEDAEILTQLQDKTSGAKYSDFYTYSAPSLKGSYTGDAAIYNVDDKYDVAFAVGDILIDNGVKQTIFHRDTTLDGTYKAPRNVFGWDDDYFYVFFCEGRNDVDAGFTLTQVTDLLYEKGIQNAVNFDGGGSTMLMANMPKSTKINAYRSDSENQLRVTDLNFNYQYKFGDGQFQLSDKVKSALLAYANGTYRKDMLEDKEIKGLSLSKSQTTYSVFRRPVASEIARYHIILNAGIISSASRASSTCHHAELNVTLTSAGAFYANREDDNDFFKIKSNITEDGYYEILVQIPTTNCYLSADVDYASDNDYDNKIKETTDYKEDDLVSLEKRHPITYNYEILTVETDASIFRRDNTATISATLTFDDAVELEDGSTVISLGQLWRSGTHLKCSGFLIGGSDEGSYIIPVITKTGNSRLLVSQRIPQGTYILMANVSYYNNIEWKEKVTDEDTVLGESTLGTTGL